MTAEIQHQGVPQMASVTELGKRLATHQAHCALDGLELQAIEDGSGRAINVVASGPMTRTLSDLEAVEPGLGLHCSDVAASGAGVVVMRHDRDHLRQNDLLRACIHEFAHLHVARHHGIPGHVRIHGNPNAGDGKELRFIGGRFYFWQDCPDTAVLRQIGLAGLAAEAIQEDENIEGWKFQEWLDFDCIELSDTDSACAGQFTECDLENVIKLVRALWNEIMVDVGREMAVWAVLTDEKVDWDGVSYADIALGSLGSEAIAAGHMRKAST